MPMNMDRKIAMSHLTFIWLFGGQQ